MKKQEWSKAPTLTVAQLIEKLEKLEQDAPISFAYGTEPWTEDLEITGIRTVNSVWDAKKIYEIYN